MQRQIWITLIASGVLVFGVPDRAVAQDNGLGPRMLGQAPPFGPIQRLLYGRRPDLAAAAAAQSGQLTTAAALPAAAGTFITFDAPGACATAGTQPGCTEAVAINPAGTILGYSVDANGMPHGFLRDRDGTFTSFDVPGAVVYSLAFEATSTGQWPPGTSLNPAGETTGTVGVPNSAPGFIRDKDGVITTFDAPGAALTLAQSINPAGEVTGFYLDTNPNLFAHGFFRDASGNVISFDPPGAGTDSNGCFFGLTYAEGINAAGEITGYYWDPQCLAHGFLRKRNGDFTVVDVPEFTGYTFPLSINDGGDITGWGPDATHLARGFVRDHNGSIAIFDLPDLRDFGPADINSAGVVVGWYVGHFGPHSFRRTSDGTLTSLDFTAAGTEGTLPTSINAKGEITGTYIDSNGVCHGFLFIPR